MSKSSIRLSSPLSSRYGQQWKSIITQQWEEVWQITADRIDQVPSLIVNGLKK